MGAPTREDAQLMIQIMQLGETMGMKQAAAVLMSDDFDPQTADASDEAVSTTLSMGELIGTFVKHDLLSLELVDDLIWIQGSWDRVGPAALRERERHGEPRLFENLEALAQRASGA
jgi:hypothetical protein